MTRADTQKAQRRRRNTDSLSGKTRKLSLDESKLDRQNYVYRFANDEPGRLHNLTALDDWDVVEDREGNLSADQTAVGSEVSRYAGQAREGQTRTVLLRKPRNLHDEDQQAKQRRIDATEAGIRGGEAPGADNNPREYYQPREGVSITHGGKS